MRTVFFISKVYGKNTWGNQSPKSLSVLLAALVQIEYFNPDPLVDQLANLNQHSVPITLTLHTEQSEGPMDTVACRPLAEKKGWKNKSESRMSLNILLTGYL